MSYDVTNFRQEIVNLAIEFPYEHFHRAALFIIPDDLKEYIGPKLPEIYMDIQEEVAVDLAKREQLQSRCKAL